MTNGPINIIRTAIIAILLVARLLCAGQPGMPQSEVIFLNDNDVYLFNKQDQYYTNGVFISVRKSVDSTRLARTEVNRLWDVTIGQQMYNAYTAHIQHIDEIDRPITAYLFAAAHLDRHFADESFISFSGEIGTIGKRAFGRQLQEGIHKVFGLYDIAGWEYQLNNAFGLDLSAGYGRLLYRPYNRWFDVSARADATVGLNHTRLSAGPTVRIGLLNPLHQSALVSARLQSRAAQSAPELFLHYSPQVTWVGYDATVQGGLLLQDKGPITYTPTRWVWHHRVGVVYARHTITLRLQYVFYTKEVPGMFFRHRYGSLGLGYRF